MTVGPVSGKLHVVTAAQSPPAMRHGNAAPAAPVGSNSHRSLEARILRKSKGVSARVTKQGIGQLLSARKDDRACCRRASAPGLSSPNFSALLM